MIVIDTSIIIALFDESLPQHRRAMELVKGIESPEEVIIPTFVAAEFLLGLPDNKLTDGENFLELLSSRPFEPPVHKDLAGIREIRGHKRKHLAINDYLLSAIAARHRSRILTLETRIKSI